MRISQAIFILEMGRKGNGPDLSKTFHRITPHGDKVMTPEESKETLKRMSKERAGKAYGRTCDKKGKC